MVHPPKLGKINFFNQYRTYRPKGQPNKRFVHTKAKFSPHTMVLTGCIGDGVTAAALKPFFVSLLKYVQGDYIGFNTGNGEKLSYSQAAGLA